MQFDYDIGHVSRKHLYIANTLHMLLAIPDATICKKSAQKEVLVHELTANLPASADHLSEYHAVQEQDSIGSQIIALCKHRSPKKDQLTRDLLQYRVVRGEPSLHDDLLLWGHCIVMSQGLQQKTLHKIHSRHQAILQCHLHLSSAVWWTGINQETGGATSERLPSLHLGECSSQAAHDLLSPIQSSMGAGRLGLIWKLTYWSLTTSFTTSANALTDTSKSAKIANWPTLSTTCEHSWG